MVCAGSVQVFFSALPLCATEGKSIRRTNGGLTLQREVNKPMPPSEPLGTDNLFQLTAETGESAERLIKVVLHRTRRLP